MTKLHFGIIGCGVIGPVHAASLAQLPSVHMVGVCDTVRERAQRLADEYALPYITTDYRELLARADIDAVCICTPHYLHAEMAIAAARAGKHIFCEKPLAITATEMDAMIAAADDAGVQLGVCFQHRFDPVVVQLKRLVDEGHFGRLLLGGAHCRCLRTDAYYQSEAWRGTWMLEGGGVLINQAIHTIDLLLWLFGDATSVYGNFATLRWGDAIEVEDTATGILTFRNGAQGHLAATTASNLDWQSRLHLYGSAGAAVVNTGYPDEFTFLQLSSEQTIADPQSAASALPGKTCYGTSHILALDAFTNAVLHNTPYPIPGREARRAVDAILGLYRAAREGQVIPL